MRRYSLLALLVLVRLTDLTGRDVFVAQDSVVWVGEPRGCSGDAHSLVNMSSGSSICLSEDVVDVVKKIRNGYQ